MSRSISAATALTIVTMSIALQHAQTPQSGTVFRGGVEYVQVDARVVDASGEPIRGLTRRDFKVFEDGVEQNLRTFSVVDIPAPEIARSPEVPSLKADVSTNVRANAGGRTYLIVFDALQVAPTRTLIARKILRDFIQRDVSPDDVVAVVSLGMDRAFENFTHDKSRLLAAIDALMGQSAPSPTVAAATDVGARSDSLHPGSAPIAPPTPIGGGVTNDTRQSLRRLAQVVQAMSTSGDGSKAIILVSESTPIDPLAETESLTFFEASSLIPDMQRASMAVRLGNVPIYPVYPRGLTDGAEDAIEIRGGVQNPTGALLAEARRQQDALRVIADDSGGFPIVGTNDLAAGLSRVARLSSSYYVLGYNSPNTKADGRYHRISVKVSRPDARVLSRKGYNAPHMDTSQRAPLAGPPGASIELRDALNAALPVSSVAMSMTAGAFRNANGRNISATVVVETPGVEVVVPENKPAAVLEMTAVAIEKRGLIRNGEHGRVQLSASSDAIDRVKRSGFRWIARLENLTPGRYEIRGAVNVAPSRQGSVWYELEIPDLSKAALTMSDVMLTSTAASTDRMTVRADKTAAAIPPFAPTARRDFSANDSVAIYAEVYDNDHTPGREIETSVAVIDDRGNEKARTVETQTAANGVVKIGTRVALAPLAPGAYILAVEARQAANRSVSAGRAVPFRVIDR